MAIEAEFLRTADLLPEAMLLLDRQGTIRAVNQAARRLLGADAKAGTALEALSSAPARAQAVVQGAFRTGQLTPGLLLLSGPDGVSVPCRTEGALYRGRGETHADLALLRLTPREEAVGRFIALSQRVDELTREVALRARAEAALHAERERLRVTLWSIGDAVITADTGGCVRFMNPVAEALTGWSLQDALGRPLEEVFVIVGESTGERVMNPVAEVLRAGTVVGLANHTVLIARDGSERPIDDSAAPVRDHLGRVIGVVMVFHDVTERRAMEHSLRRQAEDLVLADRRKDEFLAMLAHELRNPLAPLANGVRILQLAGTQGSAAAEEILAMMQRQVRHLTRMVDDLLDVARITRGAVSLQRQPVDLHGVLEVALEQTRPLFDGQGQDLVAALPEHGITVHADATRLTQVFANLLSNASKFSPPGARIALDWQRLDDGVVRVRVNDSGIGIPAEAIDDIFELFAQGGASLDRSRGGLGIGLTVVRALVEMHGGRVHAASAGPGKGSVFSVDLPTMESDSRPPATATVGSATSAAPKRILVVDDNVDHALSLARLLEHRGDTVRVAHDGAGALAAVASFDPDVVLLDIGLPGLDGYEVARRLRAEAPRALTLIAVTGYDRDQDRARGRAAGFDHHLAKPVDFEALGALLDGLPG